MTSRRSPREPGSAIVRGAGRSRVVVPAQWRTRHPDGARFPACPRPVGRKLWGRASSLPVRDVEFGWAYPRECGTAGLGGIPGRGRGHGHGHGVLLAPAFWAAPGDPASHNQRGRSVVTGRASTTLIARAAASLVAGRTMISRATRGSPVAPLCGARGGAGWWFQHNGVPGTPMGCGFPRILVSFGAGRARVERASRGSPACALCGARCGAGRLFRHNVMPGTPRWRGGSQL